MSDSAGDLAVVIPTRDRWPILRRTLDGLRSQSVAGFEVVVVVDGLDQQPPDLGVRTVMAERGGPGAARNKGVTVTDRRLALLLGDDMIPDRRLVELHVERHRLRPEDEVAVLGHVDWHPQVRRSAAARWLDWSASQFDFGSIDGDRAGYGHFYSSNVSIKRSFFLDAGGFDEDFTEAAYEDIDLGWRLDQRGMRLVYERDAVAHHLHHYDLAGLERRYRTRGRAERRMVAKHPWFPPFFAERIKRASDAEPVSRLWPSLARVVPSRPGRVRRAVEWRADLWYHQRLASAFMEGWEESA